MFAILHSDINSLKSGLLHLTSQPHCEKCSTAKVKDGIINLIIRNYLVDRYNTVMTLESFEIISPNLKNILQYTNTQKVQKWLMQFSNSYEKPD